MPENLAPRIAPRYRAYCLIAHDDPRPREPISVVALYSRLPLPNFPIEEKYSLARASSRLLIGDHRCHSNTIRQVKCGALL
jgi:hypothetical protein